MGQLLWLGTLTLAMAAMPAVAAEIKVISAEAARGALETIAEQYKKDTGNTVSFEFMTAGQVRDKVQAGEAPDIAVGSNAVIPALVQSGKATAATDLGRIGMAIAIREGAPRPDVSTQEAFVKTLRAARSVSFTNPAAGGTAGIFFADLLKRLGIADEMAGKIVHSSGGRDAAAKVASGEAEFGFTFPSEIAPVKGAAVGGMFPEALQNYTTYTAVIPAANKNPVLAQSYLAALTAAKSRPLWVAAGFEPLGKGE
jgi:molybdate transport system substrate-binding protein